jgi:hypothetical protein
MVNSEKILKQKNSLSSGINISIGLVLAGLTVATGLICGFGGTFSTVAGVYLGYKFLRLILRVLSLVFSLLITLVSIAILILIISLLIF